MRDNRIPTCDQVLCKAKFHTEASRKTTTDMRSEPAIPRESVIRDKLAERLDLIEPNLELVAVEHYLPNPDGASGFVDILVRDARGDLVIIELKRDDKSARQALHELEKYVGLMSQVSGLRTDQMRCILVSTSWHELALPFSRYKKHADFYLKGLHLFLDTEGELSHCDEFVGYAGSVGNELCPMYMGMLFGNPESRDNAAEQIVAQLASFSIEDYILIDVDHTGPSGWVSSPFGIFVAFAMFPPAVEQHVCALFPEETEDVYEDEDYWHEQVIQTQLSESIQSEEIENSSPDGLASEVEWTKSNARGFGAYGNSLVWPENVLLRLIAGADSAHTVNYTTLVSTAHAQAWSRMRSTVARVIDGDGAWPEVIGAWLDESEDLNAEINVQIYSPSNVLSGLEALARSSDDSYIAALAIGRKFGSRNNLVWGTIVWDGTARDCSLQDVLNRADTDLLDYLAGSSWVVEPSIMNSLGLRYVTMESSPGSSDLPGDAARELSVVSGALARGDGSGDSLASFLVAHPIFTESLLAAYERTIFR
ncbi:hypothetical protein HDC94_000930 [Leifsonia sp. AK011]|uniref:endonuclease NucS domain-containing protein n=1 Tax=Leifsonia sp. AK011 TaxID=2723075 RepID=UPI0015CB8D5E|nr:endonuclease NucS domain-containing protein [Leifsonia sp. AK011]NYF09774.1 hypothetical protein [Leifsonia sp. AK011]